MFCVHSYIGVFNMAEQKPPLDNRVVNMKILIQNVFPGAVRPPKKDNRPNKPNKPAWNVVDNTVYDKKDDKPSSSGGSITFDYKRNINKQEKIKEEKFVPSWLR